MSIWVDVNTAIVLFSSYIIFYNTSLFLSSIQRKSPANLQLQVQAAGQKASQTGNRLLLLLCPPFDVGIALGMPQLDFAVGSLELCNARVIDLVVMMHPRKISCRPSMLPNVLVTYYAVRTEDGVQEILTRHWNSSILGFHTE